MSRVETFSYLLITSWIEQQKSKNTRSPVATTKYSILVHTLKPLQYLFEHHFDNFVVLGTSRIFAAPCAHSQTLNLDRISNLVDFINYPNSLLAYLEPTMPPATHSAPTKNSVTWLWAPPSPAAGGAVGETVAGVDEGRSVVGGVAVV
jgi:hypothetical protein